MRKLFLFLFLPRSSEKPLIGGFRTVLSLHKSCELGLNTSFLARPRPLAEVPFCLSDYTWDQIEWLSAAQKLRHAFLLPSLQLMDLF